MFPDHYLIMKVKRMMFWNNVTYFNKFIAPCQWLKSDDDEKAHSQTAGLPSMAADNCTDYMIILDTIHSRTGWRTLYKETWKMEIKTGHQILFLFLSRYIRNCPATSLITLPHYAINSNILVYSIYSTFSLFGMYGKWLRRNREWII
jgi:hypothetical protein